MGASQCCPKGPAAELAAIGDSVAKEIMLAPVSVLL